MEGNYEVLYAGESVGKAQLLRQGLYLRIVCRYRISKGEVCRLVVSWQNAWENLGIPVPEGDGFILRKKIPAKHIGEGELRFQLIPIGQDVDEMLFPQTTDPAEASGEERSKEETKEEHSSGVPVQEDFGAELHRPEQMAEEPDNQEHTIPIREDIPFDPLDRLDEAILVTREGQAFALFSPEKGCAEAPSSDIQLETHGTVI